MLTTGDGYISSEMDLAEASGLAPGAQSTPGAAVHRLLIRPDRAFPAKHGEDDHGAEEQRKENPLLHRTASLELNTTALAPVVTRDYND